MRLLISLTILLTTCSRRSYILSGPEWLILLEIFSPAFIQRSLRIWNFKRIFALKHLIYCIFHSLRDQTVLLWGVLWSQLSFLFFAIGAYFRILLCWWILLRILFNSRSQLLALFNYKILRLLIFTSPRYASYIFLDIYLFCLNLGCIWFFIWLRGSDFYAAGRETALIFTIFFFYNTLTFALTFGEVF